MESKSKKRKLQEIDAGELPRKSVKKAAADGVIAIQIVTGSYDRVLHGMTATIPSIGSSDEDVSFADTFLFQAHSAAIRCLAISPQPSGKSKSSKLILASGSTDEKINLYNLSTSLPPARSVPLPSAGDSSIKENPKNREVGTLVHHGATVTALDFPTRTKLLSASEDNTITITRTRDWTAVSTIKIPIPKPQGRPSGDTFALGDSPAGVNDFAIHPSLKLMVSVSRGEKCMRLWNLVTGKKAGVLNFGKEILQDIGEGRWADGEGRKIVWNPAGERFAVSFERGAVVFGLDCKPHCRIVPSPRTKIHWIDYISLPLQKSSTSTALDVLVVSTEDGRILFYNVDELITASKDETNPIPDSQIICHLGGKASATTSRVKAFEIIQLHTDSLQPKVLVVAGSSDGTIRIWHLEASDSKDATQSEQATTAQEDVLCGKLIGTYETGRRITCLKAFALTGSLEESDEE